MLDRLRKERERRGIPLRQLAPVIGVHYTTLQQYESGKTVPTLEKLDAWCTARGVHLSVESVTPLSEAQAAALGAIADVMPRLSDNVASMAAAAVLSLENVKTV